MDTTAEQQSILAPTPLSRRRFLSLAAVGVAGASSASLLAACRGGGAAGGGDTIAFGAMLPLTGGVATEGKKQKEGYDLWMEVVNKAGGIRVGNRSYRVDVKYYDYQSDNATAVKLTEKLITEDSVKFLLGPFGSATGKAVSAVAEKNRIPLILVSSASKEVFTEGFRYTFGTLTPNETLADPLTEIVSRLDPQVRTVAIIARNDLFPLAMGNATKAAAEARGLRVVQFDQYPIGAKDHSSILTLAKSNTPDWLYVTGYVEDLVPMVKEMRQLAVDARLVTMVAAPAYQEFIDGLGKDADYISSAMWWHPKVRYDGADVFKTADNYSQLFKAKYGYLPDYINASPSLAGVLFQLALERAGAVDPEKVRDELAKMDVTTFFGPVRFNPQGQNSKTDAVLFQILDSKVHVFAPPTIADARLAYPQPSWAAR
jgi:branched-chain amino acid transport system substrate-binding protein